MAFVYDYNKEFENFVNPNSVIWVPVETEYWKNFLQKLIYEHYKETNSKIAKKIIENFSDEIKNFIQICPKEMLNKLSNSLSLKSKILKVV